MSCDLAYVIQADEVGGIVKVGRSARPSSRIKSIGQTVPFGLRRICILSNGAETERELKLLLAGEQVKGEWFQPTVALIDYLGQCRERGMVLRQMPVTSEYVAEHIQPRLLAYIQAKPKKTITDTGLGDLVFRILNGDPLTFIGRENMLLSACPDTFAGHEVFGWCSGGSVEPISLPGLSISKAERLIEAVK